MTFQTTVDGLRHEQGKMKDNERAENEMLTKQIAVLKADVTQLRETQISQGKTTNVTKNKLRHEERKEKERSTELAIINMHIVTLQEEVE